MKTATAYEKIRRMQTMMYVFHRCVSGGASGRFGVVFQASDKADSEYDGTDVGD